MSEFKFACPVCGQHITADSSTSGGEIECPTCFQKIVVPQAPASAETKLILSASQVSKPRPMGTADLPKRQPKSRSRLSVVVVAVTLLLLCGAGAAVFVLRDRIMGAIRRPVQGDWSLNLSNASFPETNATGRIHGRPFTCQEATLQNVTLALRQGRGWPPDLGVSLVLPRQLAHDPAGRTLEIQPEQKRRVPRVVLHWKDEQQKPVKQDFTGGYALKLAFEQASNGRVSGKIYLCLPDEAKSVVAGRFEAAIRKPKAAKPRK